MVEERQDLRALARKSCLLLVMAAQAAIHASFIV
jgi:hypothetical protein